MKVKLRVSIEYETDLGLNPTDDDEEIKFFYEDHFCVDNLIQEIADQIENNKGFCSTCYRADVEVLEIKRA